MLNMIGTETVRKQGEVIPKKHFKLAPSKLKVNNVLTHCCECTQKHYKDASFPLDVREHAFKKQNRLSFEVKFGLSQRFGDS